MWKQGYDPCETTYGDRRIAVLDAQVAARLNNELKGSRFPIVSAVVSLLGNVGTVGGLFLELVQSATYDPDVRARQGDEVWRVDLVGRKGHDVIYAYYLVLVDPKRSLAWILNEERKTVLYEQETQDELEEWDDPLPED